MRKILCFIAVLLPCACTVKEDRSVCPCELVVRCEESLKTEGSVLVSVIQDDAVVKQGMMSREDFEAGRCVMSVPRKPSLVTVFTGITDMNAIDGRWLDIAFEHQCDELYSCAEYVDLKGESYECIVGPHKNFARLFLTVIGMPAGAEASVTGPVQGYNLMDQSPVPGTFSCSPFIGKEGDEDCVRLPRQIDNALALNIMQKGKPSIKIDIGRMIESAGYRYDDPDLLDIALTVDLSKSSVWVMVADWDMESFSFLEY
ncbi:MAG: hypothetical protein IKX67_02015 [Bacteroidales bacterium]|nr:hypothetical protein [Bacteroidales bacterium]